MRQLISRLTLRQRITIGVVAAIVIAALYGAAHWNKERDFKPLFT
jgi:hypothetical protein